MEWLISANHSKYDHIKAFKELPYIDWKQTASFEEGDEVYIYSSKPTSAIEFLAEVIKTNISSEEALDDKEYWKDLQEYESGKSNGKYVRLQLMKIFSEDKITLEELHNHGLKGNIQGPRKFIDDNNNLLPWGAYIREQISNISLNLLDNVDYTRKVKEINRRIEANEQVYNSELFISDEGDFSYSDELKKRTKPYSILLEKTKFYTRDRNVVKNAFVHANYRCEIDSNHHCFMKKDGKTPYTEAHHLIPMAFQDEFEYSLDVEENVVSLCSSCHNEIHYGSRSKEIVTKLYYERIELLRKKEIGISLEKLLNYYSFK